MPFADDPVGVRFGQESRQGSRQEGPGIHHIAHTYSENMYPIAESKLDSLKSSTTISIALVGVLGLAEALVNITFSGTNTTDYIILSAAGLAIAAWTFAEVTRVRRIIADIKKHSKPIRLKGRIS